MIKAVIGLGNPGQKYSNTRHNVGFAVVDELAQRLEGNWNGEKKSGAQITKVMVGEKKILLVKPQTYMNNSGEAVLCILSLNKLKPKEIMVVADDINLELGIIRFRDDGGDGGHKGLRSVVENIGTRFHRLRVGVGKNVKQSAEDFVLMPIGESEVDVFRQLVDKAGQNLIEYIVGELGCKTVDLNIK